MKRTSFLILIAILSLAVISAQAQFGNLKKVIKDKSKTGETQTKPETTENKTESVNKTETKTNNDPNFLFVGVDGMEGDSITNLRACSTSFPGGSAFKSRFKQWIEDISATAQEKLFANKRCELMGFHIQDNPSHKYRNADSLETLAQGNSAYRIEGNNLVLVKDFSTTALYVVVVPEVNKAGLTLKELNLGVKPDLKDTYRRKANSVFNYHDLKQALYIFEKYKKYPSPSGTNSVLFLADDFETLNKQGKFKGLIVYRLVGDSLEPMK